MEKLIEIKNLKTYFYTEAGTAKAVDGVSFDIYKGTEMTVPVEYAAIKSAIQHLSVYTTAYTKGSKFRVNCISPGGIQNNQDKTFIKKIEKLIPLGRMAKKNEYKEIIQYLCTDSSSYMTGQNIVIDGGRGQLNIAKQIILENNITSITLMSISKGKKRNAGREIVHLHKNNKVMYNHFFLQL